MKKYKIELLQYYQNTVINSGCNGITFINTGAISVQINQFVLAPGASISIGANEGEEDCTEYNLNFGGATNGALFVIKKMFV